MEKLLDSTLSEEVESCFEEVLPFTTYSVCLTPSLLLNSKDIWAESPKILKSPL